MSSADNHQSSATRGQSLLKKPFDLPSHVNQLPLAEQSPVPETIPPPGSGVTPRQSLIKNPLQLAGRAGQPAPTQQLQAPDTVRVPENGVGTPVRQSLIKNPLQLAGRAGQPAPTQQLQTPDTAVSSKLEYNPSPSVTRPLSEPITPLSATSLLPEPITSPRVTRHLPEYQTVTTRPLTDEQTGALSSYLLTGTTPVRQPVVIPATNKKPSSPQGRPPRRRRRWSAQIVVTGLIVLITVSTLLSVVPVDKAGDHLLNPFQSISNLVQTSGGNPSSIAQQDATATVTHQDGYDPGNNVPLAPGGAFDHFAFGQCTYYASLRYHQLTGQWIPWLGNAYQWAYGARQFGWVVSSTPKVPSIIVLQGGVQGAGWFGHVAVVESINPDGSVTTSNWNWYGPGGNGWARLSVVTFRPGPGVYFVWHA